MHSIPWRRKLGSYVGCACLVLSAVSHQAFTQVTVPAPRPAPAAIAASSAAGLGNITSVRVLEDGRVLANDMANRKVLLIDLTLMRHTIVLGDGAGADRVYPTRGEVQLLAYHGDSTLVLDAGSASFIVLDPSGTPARVAAVPRASDIAFLSPLLGTATVDQDHLVYTVRLRSRVAATASPWDSATLVRANFVSRVVDTLGRVGVRREQAAQSRDEGSVRIVIRPVAPFEIGDDWVGLPNGSFAILRQNPFRIDLVRPDSPPVAGPTMAWDWRSLSDSAKQHIVDSLGPVLARRDSARWATSSSRSTRISQVPIPAALLPDYVPPFVPRTARADRLGRIWIRETLAGPHGGTVYAIIDPSRFVVTDRIEFGPDRTVVGFSERGALLSFGLARARRLEWIPIR